MEIVGDSLLACGNWRMGRNVVVPTLQCDQGIKFDSDDDDWGTEIEYESNAFSVFPLSLLGELDHFGRLTLQ